MVNRGGPETRAIVALLMLALAACSPVTPTVPRTVGPRASHAAAESPAAEASDLPSRPGASPLVPLASASPFVFVPPTTAGPVTLSAALAAHATISLADAGLISDAGAGLIGKVKAPAGVVSNNGASLVGPTAFSVLAVFDQVPVTNKVVCLLDATGRVVVDSAGTPLATVTDAAGGYAIPGLRATRNLLVAADLGAAGLVQGVASKAAASAPVTVDLDLLSSLTTGYILDRYVLTQPDPLVTFDRLTPDAEAQTRVLALAAFTGGTAAVPDSLQPAALVRTVEQLRGADGAFDSQLERVRRLLIPAGQLNLGEGLLADQVVLGGISHLAFAGDGSLFICCAVDRRVWRVRSDGRLEVAAGKGRVVGAADATLTGKSAPDAIFNQFLGAVFDDQERLVLLETSNRISRRAPDGTLTELSPLGVWQGEEYIRAAVPVGGDTVLAFTTAGKLWSLTPGQARRQLADLGAAGKDAAKYTEQYGVDGAGRLYLNTADDTTYQPHRLVRIDPASGTMTTLLSAADGLKGFTVDTRGNAIIRTADNRLQLRRPSGALEALAPQFDAFDLGYNGAALGPDGAAYLSEDIAGKVYRIAADVVTRIAGGALTAGPVEGVAFNSPSGVLVHDGGELLVTDSGAGTLTRLGADGQATLLAGGGTDYMLDAPSLATAVKLQSPIGLREDAAGNLYFIMGGICQLDHAGQLTKRMSTTNASVLYQDLLVAPDGGMTVGRFDIDGATGLWTPRVFTLAPGSNTPVYLFDLPPFSPSQANPTAVYLAQGPDGVLYISGDGKLRRWTAAAGLVTLKMDPAFKGQTAWLAGFMTVDPAGRIVTMGKDRVWRYDPVGDRVEAIAGPGTARFAGTGVDDSLLYPTCPVFDAAGNLFLADHGHKQIKKIPAE